MAYRRRQGITRVSTFKEEVHNDHNHNQSSVNKDDLIDSISASSSSSISSSSPSLAAQAIRASAAHRESSLSSAYGDSTFEHRVRSEHQTSGPYEDASMTNESKYGFWGVLARKAKVILDDENESQQFETTGRKGPQVLETSRGNQFHGPFQQKAENPRFRKGLDALTSSLNQIGDSFEKAFEEGRTIVENKTADIIQETRKLQIRRKGNDSDAQNLANGVQNSWQKHLQPIQPVMQSNQQNQLKASRDVAMATAAKAKLLLRELKTVKADLAFAKERCAQLEEENKVIRESRVKGNNHADDDLIRLQLETLLAEKARLAHENSIYARENRFLREIVEYHQLTMQDVVYLDEGSEEVTEVYPFSIPGVSRMLSVSPPLPRSPPSPVTEQIFPPLFSSEVNNEDISSSEVSSPGSNIASPLGEDSER